MYFLGYQIRLKSVYFLGLGLSSTFGPPPPPPSHFSWSPDPGEQTRFHKSSLAVRHKFGFTVVHVFRYLSENKIVVIRLETSFVTALKEKLSLK